MDDVISLERLVISSSSSHKLNDAFADVVINTDEGSSIRAHRSILRNCFYFSAMLQGDWIENQTSSINITGYNCMVLWIHMIITTCFFVDILSILYNLSLIICMILAINSAMMQIL